MTLVRGSPCIWLEYHGIAPELGFGGALAKYFDRTGQPLTLPITGDCVGLEYKERTYGVFAPDGTRFQLTKEGLAVAYFGQAQYLVLCPLPVQRPRCRLPPCFRHPARHTAVLEIQPGPRHRDHDLEDHHRGAQGQRKADHPGLAAAPLPQYHP